MHEIQLGSVDYTILIVYFAFVLGIGWTLKRYTKTSTDFFLSGRSIPSWITGLAFLSANLGAQEVIGMAASGAKYGIMTSHFYWVGAIPAMVFVGIFMMPFYYGSKARSVPEYLKLRFDEKTRAFNAMSFAVMTVFSSGISMHALARLLEQILGFDYHMCIFVSAGIVLVYIVLGGLTSAIYNEVLQFFMIVFGFLPLTLIGLKGAGGWTGLKHSLAQVATSPSNPAGHGFDPTAWTSSWSHMGQSQANPMGVEWFGMVMGLGFVLSFGYWCTDFLVVQRAMAANSMSAARRTPLIAAFPKMLFPALVILPGMLAISLHFNFDTTKFRLPVESKAVAAKIAIENAGLLGTPADKLTEQQKQQLDEMTAEIKSKIDSRSLDGALQASVNKWEAQIARFDTKSLDYNMVIPSLLQYYLPTGLLGIALTALMASFMSGMAGNVTAFNTVWTYDIYQSYINPNKPDKHYLSMGHVITVVGVLISVACAYAARSFNNIMDMLQLVFGFVNAPLFATFLLGMFWKRSTGHGAFWGLVAGTGAAALHHGLTLPANATVGIKGGWLVAGHVLHTYPVEMAQNFWAAIYAWTACFVVTIVISLATKRLKTDDELRGLVYSLTPKVKEHGVPWFKQPAALAVVVLLAVLVLNILFW
ncbi:MAG TPA: sodium:solute symporter family protein [Phycisphaerae bacterium]|nr:sodium:solute symporter family protein [Phycisphaerae bacterium]